MSGIAITMMVIAMVALWGGLALAIWNLSRHDDDVDPGVFQRDL